MTLVRWWPDRRHDSQGMIRCNALPSTPSTRSSPHWWSKGRIENGRAVGYREWYRIDGTLKRSGHVVDGEPAGEWITYDSAGQPYKTTVRGGDAGE